MTITIDAVYSGGTLHPVGTVDLPENQRVRLAIEHVTVAPKAVDVMAWLEEARAFHKKLAERVGILPDSTADIRACRYGGSD